MIVSRFLKEKMTLVRGKENLTIKTLIKTGRSCTAVCINGKGKEEKLSITDMWNQKITILNPDKKIPETKKVVKEKQEPKEKGIPVKKTEVERAGGVCTTYYAKDGSVLWSAWNRTR
jgi:hypothetical protein